MADIRTQKFLYHLTSINNIGNIFEHGLKSRSALKSDEFIDVADSEILESRKNLSLENCVPFHFFAKNPFDGKVQKTRPNEKFALIAIKRDYAKSQNWQVIPRHPLANGAIEILSYDEGFERIDWELMSIRDYHNEECKSICMAECLSPKTVPAESFFAIYVCCSESEAIINELKHKNNLSFHLNNNPEMFVK
jgi:hypothetical protein